VAGIPGPQASSLHSELEHTLTYNLRYYFLYKLILLPEGHSYPCFVRFTLQMPWKFDRNTFMKNDTLRFCFFGDSLVDRKAIVIDDPHYNLPVIGSQVEVKSHETAGFFKLIQQILTVRYPTQTLEFLNRAKGGSTIRQVQYQVEKFCKKSLSADVSLICVGINDVMRKYQGLPDQHVLFDEFAERYTSVLSSLKTKSKIILCLGEPLVQVKDSDEINKELYTYVSFIKDLSDSATGIYYIDLFNIFKDTHSALSSRGSPHSLWTDGVHLSDLGNALAADTIMKALEQEEVQRILFQDSVKRN